jgi:TolB protein
MGDNVASRHRGRAVGRIIGVLSVLASAAILLALAAPAQATFPGQNGKVAYSSCGLAGDCGVFIADPDGSGATQITHNPYRIETPHGGSYAAPDAPSSWTPDGGRISYVRIRPNGDEARIVNADGTGDEAFGAPTTAVFSPDGSKLAYVSFNPYGYPQIFVSNIDGSGVTQLTRGTGAYDPDWSPDGTKNAFTQGPDFYGGPEIYVMNADGSNQTRLTFELDHGAWAWDPSWSPDGARIAFTRTYQGEQYEIYSMNADGSGLINLTDNPEDPPNYARIDDEDAAWSPDGTQIAFVRDRSDVSGDHVFTMNADGSGARPLLSGPSLSAHPIWQSLTGPQRSDHKTAAQFCKAERDFLGDSGFRQKYGGGANAHGTCVSGNK